MSEKDPIVGWTDHGVARLASRRGIHTDERRVLHLKRVLTEGASVNGI